MSNENTNNDSKNSDTSSTEKEIIKVLDLKNPIISNGEKVTQLKFRRLNGASIRKVGYPFKMFTDGSYELKGDKISQLIESYCNLSAGASDQLNESDHFQAGMIIASFFTPSTD